MTIRRSVEVERPVEDLWEVLKDVRRLPEFSSSTVAVLDAPELITHAGQRFRQVVEVMGRRFESDWEVTDVELGRRVSIKGNMGPGGRYWLVQEIEPLGPDRSRFSLTMDYKLPFGPLGRVAGVLGVAQRAEREAGEVVEGIKRLVEAGPRSA
jgi:uncharacterized membrane protein